MVVGTKPAVLAPGERRRFTVDEYERMAELGVLGEDERIELIGGEIVAMAAMNARHAGCLTRLGRLVPPRIGAGALVRVQMPIAIPPLNAPEPDLAVVRDREDDYDRGHPVPEDVLLLIEVADRSLAFDRNVQVPIYARSGIREVWIVDLVGGGIERFVDPDEAAGVYRTVVRFGRGETIAAEALPGLELTVDEVLRRG